MALSPALGLQLQSRWTKYRFMCVHSFGSCN